jgi:hypothetical protein
VTTQLNVTRGWTWRDVAPTHWALYSVQATWLLFMLTVCGLGMWNSFQPSFDAVRWPGLWAVYAVVPLVAAIVGWHPADRPEGLRFLTGVLAFLLVMLTALNAGAEPWLWPAAALAGTALLATLAMRPPGDRAVVAAANWIRRGEWQELTPVARARLLLDVTFVLAFLTLGAGLAWLWFRPLSVSFVWLCLWTLYAAVPLAAAIVGRSAADRPPDYRALTGLLAFGVCGFTLIFTVFDAGYWPLAALSGVGLVAALTMPKVDWRP